jgi:hypothetical protein
MVVTTESVISQGYISVNPADWPLRPGLFAGDLPAAAGLRCPA